MFSINHKFTLKRTDIFHKDVAVPGILSCHILANEKVYPFILSKWNLVVTKTYSWDFYMLRRLSSAESKNRKVRMVENLEEERLIMISQTPKQSSIDLLPSNFFKRTQEYFTWLELSSM